MKKWIQVILFSVLHLTLLWGTAVAEKELVFNISPDGYPPYTLNEPGKEASGIFVEVLRTIAAEQGYTVKSVGVTRSRVSQLLKLGRIDATSLSKKWTKTPEDYVWSDPLLVVQDLLYSRIETPIDFKEISDLSGMTLGGHRGYRYPLLQKFFEEGTVNRSDAHSEVSMLKMVLAQRTSAAIVNEKVAQWLIKQNDWYGKFASSKNNLGKYNYRIAFNKKWKPMIPLFNQTLDRMKKDGSFDQILAKYR